MKIAVAGKGGVGKTTIVALMARVLSQAGHKVLLIDADPDMNLAAAIGVPSEVAITPIVELKELIAERTETQVGKTSPFFKLNPRVDDIPDRYCIEHEGLKLIVMGTIRKGGGGCACPENSFLKTLLSHLIVRTEQWVLLDMEAGIEHLGRGTAIGVDQMVVVVEPNQTSMATAQRIKRLSEDIGLNNLALIGNKVHSADEKRLLLDNGKDFRIAGFLDYAEEIRKSATKTASVFQIQGSAIEQIQQIIEQLTSGSRAPADKH